jgi:hypothetical protein
MLKFLVLELNGTQCIYASLKTPWPMLVVSIVSSDGADMLTLVMLMPSIGELVLGRWMLILGHVGSEYS